MRKCSLPSLVAFVLACLSTPLVGVTPIHPNTVSGALADISDPANGMAVQKDARRTDTVSDEVAYRHLFTTVALSEQLSSKEQDEVRKRIARIGLAAQDARYLELVLLNIGVREELGRITRERDSLSAEAATGSQTAIRTLLLLRTEEDDFMRYVKAQVVNGLTPGGAALLDAYVQKSVKSQIKTIQRNHPTSN